MQDALLRPVYGYNVRMDVSITTTLRNKWNHSQVNFHSVGKLLQFGGTPKCTLYLALVVSFRGATERGYKCENIIDSFNDNFEK